MAWYSGVPLGNYKVVTAAGIGELVELVNIEIENGWTPCGGISSAVCDVGFWPFVHPVYHFAQALVRKEQDA